MKQFLLLFAAAAFFSCEKEKIKTDESLVDLTFTSTTTPKVVSAESDIVARVRCYGPNLCYRFVRFDVSETGTRQFDIRAKAEVPKGNPVCAQALYQVDSTVRIHASASGQYILRFFQNNTLFKADTVQVN